MTPGYSAEFFKQQQDGSYKSAKRVLPHVLELVSPRSIVDVGCGVGTWLAVALELGVTDVLGVDGSYVDQSMLHIPQDAFRPADLAQPFSLDRTFDLAVSLEVAEHLPLGSASTIVESLTRLAPVVLFSAGIPGQTGENHLNEQWQSWWVDRFKKCGFEAVDCIRSRVWDDAAVEWWYAQNVLLMVRADHLRASSRLQQEQARGLKAFDVVHPRGYSSSLTGAELRRPRGVREWLAIGPSVVAATIRRVFCRTSRSVG
jgi:SAM-dependent methyltransferase